MAVRTRWMWLFSTLGVVGFGGCGGNDNTGPDADPAPDSSPAAPRLTVSLGRQVAATGPDVIRVTVELTRDGVAVTGAPVEIAAPTATVSAVRELGAGSYEADITPLVPSGPVPLTARALGLTVERTALVLPTVNAGWGQPELVPGMVNTAGYEDSAEVSPDGEWLIVGDYSPIDLICCQFGCDSGFANPNDPASPSCNTSLGPTGAPERPDLPGAERIISPTEIHDELPRLGFDLPDGQDLPIALPPIGSYGFHRQPDGSFAEPFAIAFDAGGITPPYGWTFGPQLDSTHYRMLFAYTDARRLFDGQPETEDDLWTDVIALGERNVLGTFTLGANGPEVDRYPQRLQLSELAGRQSNPSLASDGVFYDQDGGAVLDLRFVAGDPFGTTPLGAPITVALSRPDRAELMPYVHGDRLYFSADNQAIVSAARAPGGDPALAATWSAEQVEVGAELGTTRVGAATVVGEPSLEVRDGVESLYFIVAITRPTGVDMSLARVRRAP